MGFPSWENGTIKGELTNMENFFKKIIGDKKEYKAFKKQAAELPSPYKETFEALEKYMWNFAKGDGFLKVQQEMLEIFQENAEEQVPVKNIIGDDPVKFCDDIMSQYPDDLWLITSQNKLRKQIKTLI